VNELEAAHWLSLDDPTPPFAHSGLAEVARRLVRAKVEGSARILMAGAHLIRAGVSRHIVDICGAGDSSSAGAALALAVQGSPAEAARFGNLVASVTIIKKGTGAAALEEVLAADSARIER
jgi:sugar/nucleoside kinase (ribokinase family)